METVFEFTLPKGYLDSTGQLHRKGKMRLATAGDEISATREQSLLPYHRDFRKSSHRAGRTSDGDCQCD